MNWLQILSSQWGFVFLLGVRSASEKPRHVLIALQSDRSGDQDKNPGLFDHLSATQISVILNDTTYPAHDVIADFKKHTHVEYYKMFTEFARDYYGVDPLTVSNFVDIITYKEEFPVFYFDASKQSDGYQNKNAICRKCGANVVAYALVLSERRLKFQSNGKKLNVIY